MRIRCKQVAVGACRKNTLNAELVFLESVFSKAHVKCVNLYCSLNYNVASVRRAKHDVKDALHAVAVVAKKTQSRVSNRVQMKLEQK